MNALDAAATMLKSEAAALCSCHTTNGEDWGEDTQAHAAHDLMLRAAHALDDVRQVLVKAAAEPQMHEGDRPYMPRLLGAQDGRRALLKQINDAMAAHGEF